MTVRDGAGRLVMTKMLSGDAVFPSWLTPSEQGMASEVYRAVLHRWVLEHLNPWLDTADA